MVFTEELAAFGVRTEDSGHLDLNGILPLDRQLSETSSNTPFIERPAMKRKGVKETRKKISEGMKRAAC